MRPLLLVDAAIDAPMRDFYHEFAVLLPVSRHEAPSLGTTALRRSGKLRAPQAGGWCWKMASMCALGRDGQGGSWCARSVGRSRLQALAFTVLALPCIALSTSTLAADATGLRYSGAIRVRQEMLDGQYRPGFDDRDDIMVLRTNLFAEWDFGTWRIGGELYDSRAYDTDAGSALSVNDVDALEPVQAYVAGDFDRAFGEGTSASVQAGRFTMNVGSRRLVASDDFRNTPSGYTGIRTDLRFTGGRQATLFYVMPQLHRPDDFESLRDNRVHLDHEGRGQQLWGAVASKSGLPAGLLGEVGYIGFIEHDAAGRPTRNRRLQSLSARLIRDAAAGHWDYEVEGIGQAGHVNAGTAPTAARLTVRALFVHADLGYTLAGSWKPHMNIEYDHASGDGPGARNTHFDTLYGMRRSDLAPSGIYGAVGRANLDSLGLRLEGAPTKRLDVLATWRWMWAADRHDSFSTSGIRDASGASGRFAGQQFDGRLRYWVVPQRLRAEANAVWLLRGRLLRDAPNASPHGDTHYETVSLTLNF
jgi:hypothetical protein